MLSSSLFTTTELLLKLYMEPIAYWKSSYDILDATILLVAFLPHVSPMDAATRTHLEGPPKGLQPRHVPRLIAYRSGTRAKHSSLIKSRQRGGIPSPGVGGGSAVPRCRGWPVQEGLMRHLMSKGENESFLIF